MSRSESSLPDNPTDEEIASGLEYMSVINNEVDFGGTIWRHPDIVWWDFHSEPKQSPYWPSTKKPHLVFNDRAGNEVLRIRRSPELKDTHYVLCADEVVGTIKLVTVLRNKYTIQLEGCPLWTFHLPLFKTKFCAESADGRRIWAKVWKRKQQLFLLVPTELGASTKAYLQNTALLPALAFIHREWWLWLRVAFVSHFPMLEAGSGEERHSWFRRSSPSFDIFQKNLCSVCEAGACYKGVNERIGQ